MLFIALTFHAFGANGEKAQERTMILERNRAHSLRRNGLVLAAMVAGSVMGPREGAAQENALVAEGAEVAQLATGFGFTEGPVVDSKGNVYFSDIRKNRTHIWSVEGELSTFREDTGGANGLTFDAKGNLLACEGGRGRVTSVGMDGKVRVIAD